MTAQTPRVELRAVVPAQVLALIDQPERFEAISGAAAAAGLRDFFVPGGVDPGWLDGLRVSRESDPWRFGFFVIDSVGRQIIGCVGFEGPPDEGGLVELAYGIVPMFERCGCATAAAASAVDFAFGRNVVRVRAHTLPDSIASARVLERNAFQRVEEVEDPDDGWVTRWERGR